MANKRKPNGYVPHESGIYRIKNTANGKYYVGQSEDIAKRWFHHRWELQNGKHINLHLQAAWDKYGEESFEFQVLELCPVEELNDREKYWIFYFDALDNGYNILGGGCGQRGWTYSEEAKQRRGGARGKIRRVVQFDLNLNPIKIWDTSYQAAKALGVESEGIRSCCQHRGGQRRIKDFFWAYEDDWLSGKVTKEYYNIKSYDKDSPVCQFTKDNIFVKQWKSMREIEEILGIRTSYIWYACMKPERAATSHGYIWRLLSDTIQHIDKLGRNDFFFPLQIIKKEDVNQCQMS